MKKFLLATVAAIAFTTSATQASAAIKHPAKQPQQSTAWKIDIRVVEGCSDGKDMTCHTIYLTGDVGIGDNKRFEEALEKNKVTKAVVILNSDGGFMAAGLAIGQTIKEKNFTTAVLRNERCASVCAAIWLAGSTRYVQPQASIGFHGAYKMPIDKNNVPLKGAKPVVSSSGNALVGAYLGSLGLSYKAIYALTQASPDSMLWLSSQKQADDLGIKVTTIE